MGYAPFKWLYNKLTEISNTGIGETAYGSAGVNYTLNVRNLFVIAKFTAKKSGLYKFNLSATAGPNALKFYLLDAESILAEAIIAKIAGETSFATVNDIFTRAVGDKWTPSYIYGSYAVSYAMSLSANTTKTQTSDIYCQKDKTYVIVAQSTSSSAGSTLSISNLSITCGNN